MVAESLSDFPRPPGHGAYPRRLNRLAVLGGAVRSVRQRLLLGRSKQVRLSDFVRRAGQQVVGLLMGLALAGCQSVPQAPPTLSLAARLDASIKAMAAPEASARQQRQAQADYRSLVVDHLSELLQDAASPTLAVASRDESGISVPDDFAELTPAVARSRSAWSDLRRPGLGLPMIGRIESGDPNAPPSGYQIPLTLLAQPKKDGENCCRAVLVDPQRIEVVRTAHGDLTVAMDLEAPLAATQVSRSRIGAGLRNLLRPGAFAGDSRIVFLQPFDPDKIPVVLVHGLMSTPRMWTPLVMELLADETIRQHVQLWFFYYPTGQPVPLSALELRDALDAAVAEHGPTKPMILVGHSMGGILSRVQVSELGLAEAETMLPGIGSLPSDSLVRRALIFEPRADVGRVVFMFTPHRGSRLASSGLGAWGTRLIRLPDTLISELGAALDHLAGLPDMRLPTSIQGLSPNSQFLRVLDATTPVVPTHTILGDRGRGGDLLSSSDGVVPYTSAHLATAESELVVPAGHSGVTHPESVKELHRIILEAIDQERNVKPSCGAHCGARETSPDGE